MADTSEKEVVEPAAPPSDGSVLAKVEGSWIFQKLNQGAKVIAGLYGSNVSTSLNVSPAPQSRVQAPTKQPALTEVKLQGFKNKQAQTVVCCPIDGQYVEKNTAYDFIAMRNAAMKAGIRLTIISGFRTMEAQTKLFNERKDPVLRKQLGQAAEPGTSNHQMGVALDIYVGMKPADKAAGPARYTPTYRWLLANASRYGFDNAEVPTEPWHWRHKEMRIVANPAELVIDYVNPFIADASATAVAQGPAVDGTSALTQRQRSDDTEAFKRSYEQATSTRSVLAGAQTVDQLVVLAATTQAEASVTQASAIWKLPEKKYTNDSLKPFVYNFETGLWGDNEKV